MDAGGDVAAVCETPTITNLPARVAAQFTYDAYGQVQTCDHLLPHPFVRAGHKGLFADRLDAGVSDALAQGTEWTPSGGGAETPRLTPFATLVYDNRNRSYAPALGRFLQADPNATAMTLLEAASHSGRGLGAMVAAFDLLGRYDDGANLYQYLGGNAWTVSDPMGLYGTPFDTAMMGVTVGRFANELFSQAAFHQEMDVDWATDWRSEDDGHTRLDNQWITEIQLRFLDKEVTLVNGIFAGKLDAAIDVVRVGGKLLSRAATELHHIIPKFLGGIPKGAMTRIERSAHRIVEGNFHSTLNELCKRILELSPNGPGGTDAIVAKLRKIPLERLIEFRQEFYTMMREFDAVHGTELTAMFRREFKEQRAARGAEGLFR